jgi:hypothetical protein
MINSRAPFSFPRSLKCLVNWTRNDVNQESFPPQLFIPADIVLEIANYLVLPVDLLSFCVTVRLYIHCLNSLYY